VKADAAVNAIIDSFLDCRVIKNEDPDKYSNFGKVTSKTYYNATLNADGTISYSSFSSAQVTFTTSFDERGNA
jgi:hypothetical protein